MRTFSHVLALALALGGCVEPVQYGGPIPIDNAGFEARLQSLCALDGQTGRCAAALTKAEEPAPDR